MTPKEALIQTIEQSPDDLVQALLALLKVLQRQQSIEVLPSHLSETGLKKPDYDFSNLAGRLTWTGDAVGMQRTLRDEW
ncbi:hypothetical protein GS597_08545 [Synechococcales cyanobacterium C]|uniref:Uncharacterized protein n=1 Tax=Petrachloros mirabilis ULC683 TaxID=2781853 RepID=A0A8K1ZWJ6_9CYAN|nr:hypothetical protein [Petrachloros mirabilis]NCJ06555.1 hypothetical protein [Petrachloros mirabilis ULC683]